MSKVFLTVEEAVDLLPVGDSVHTFLQFPLGLCGADCDREEAIERISGKDYREVTGSLAREMNHGLCVYNKGDSIYDIVFFETDMDKLDRLYPPEEEVED